MRKINILISVALILSALLCVFFVALGAEKGSWTDDGSYDTAWLGDYDNTQTYTVSGKEQLAAFLVAARSGYTFEAKTIDICSNIDMSEKYWIAPYSEEIAFKGTFDGHGYVISGIEINHNEEAGGFIGRNGGEIKNVALKITTQVKYNGGICIYNGGSVKNCAVAGFVGNNASMKSGGIVFENNGSVYNCYSIAAIAVLDDPSSILGGVCAENTADIKNCYWIGTEKAVGAGDEAQSSSVIADADFLLSTLNTTAQAEGFEEWAKDTDGVFGDYCIMKNAVPADTSVSGIMFDTRELTMYVSDEYELLVRFVPESAENKDLIWLSTNESVAVVDENGKISAKGAGYATIRATTVDGGKVANCFVSVLSDKNVVKSESVKLDRKEYKVLIGQTVQIIHTISPSNVSNKSVIYKVNNEEIVSCDNNGLLTPKSPGTAVVTVTAGDGECSMAALVTVLEDSYSQTWDGTASASFAGGDGSKLNPYIIETPQQLAKLANDVNSGTGYDGCYFVQSISIRLNDTTFNDWSDRLTVVNSWTPIGASSDTPFLGHYDGAGFSVNGIYINNPSAKGMGLFGYVKKGSIQNVNLKHSVINGGEFVGGIVGFSDSKIIKCTVSANINGESCVGGVAGYSSNRLSYCDNNAIVSGTKYVGGVCGYTDSPITNCTNRASISASGEGVGGICGKAAAVIENCYNDGAVVGDTKCGGIVGVTSMDAVNCYSLIMADGMTNVGTIAGYADRVLSSYVPSNLTACGNLQNSQDYILVPTIDGSYNVKKSNISYLDVLNLYAGCVFSDTYYEWTRDGYNILPTTIVKALSSVNDSDSGCEMSGAEILGGNSYAFEDIKDEKLKAVLSKINQSSMFENTKLEDKDVLFKRNIYLVLSDNNADKIQKTSFRFTVPVDYSAIKDAEKFNEFEIFAHVAYINVTSQEMFIYIPDYVSRSSEGTFFGTMRCLAHIVNGTDVTNYGVSTQKYSFYYENGKMSFAVQNTGEWIVAELGENENIVPIETGTSEITTPPPVVEEKRQITFDLVITIVICVLLAFGAVGIILVQRSKNNIRINGKTVDEDDYYEK